MNLFKRIDKNSIIFWLINIFAGLLFWYANNKMPLCGDDLDYQMIFWTDKRITTLSDLVQSQIRHYNLWGGETVVHTICQVFLLADKALFNIANSIIFVGTIVLIQRYSFDKYKSNIFLIMEYCIFLACVPHFNDTLVWETSAVSYLWGTAIIILAIYPIYKKCEVKRLKPIHCIILFVCCFLAGWTIPAGAAGMVFALSLLLIYRKIKMNYWYYPHAVGLLGAIIGFTVMIIAPGFQNRAAIVEAIEGKRTFLYEILFRVARETYYFFINCWPIILILFVWFCVGIVRRKKVILFVKDNIVILFWVLTALASVFSMTGSSGYAERVLVSPIAFFTIGIGFMYKEIVYGQKRWSSTI